MRRKCHERDIHITGPLCRESSHILMVSNRGWLKCASGLNHNYTWGCEEEMPWERFTYYRPFVQGILSYLLLALCAGNPFIFWWYQTGAGWTVLQGWTITIPRDVRRKYPERDSHIIGPLCRESIHIFERVNKEGLAEVVFWVPLVFWVPPQVYLPGGMARESH